jgi:hypothetical protein
MIALPYWVAERINIHKLTQNSLIELENCLSDEELVWVMSLHNLLAIKDTVTPLYELHQSERSRNLSSYILDAGTVKAACYTYLRIPLDQMQTNNLFDVKVISTPNLHVMVLTGSTHTTDSTMKQLARELSGSIGFERMCTYANGTILTKYLN